MGKRFPNWVKVKKLVDEDFLACGYIAKGEQITSLVLGCMDTPLRYMEHLHAGRIEECDMPLSDNAKLPFRHATFGK